jgi:hypothetical protein
VSLLLRQASGATRTAAAIQVALILLRDVLLNDLLFFGHLLLLLTLLALGGLRSLLTVLAILALLSVLSLLVELALLLPVLALLAVLLAHLAGLQLLQVLRQPLRDALCRCGAQITSQEEGTETAGDQLRHRKPLIVSNVPTRASLN